MISIQDITSIASCVITGIGLFIAYKQLGGLKEQVALAVSNQSKDSLKIVLEIETQLNSRKLEFDKANNDFIVASKSGETNEIMETFVSTTKESYFNAMDRLCFCIQKGYVDENEYRPEYRDMIKDTIKSFESDFGPGSPYNHIKQINDKWKEC